MNACLWLTSDHPYSYNLGALEVYVQQTVTDPQQTVTLEEEQGSLVGLLVIKVKKL